MIDEILVHISTPATRQNDDLYRSLADAYLDFEPHRRLDNELEEASTVSDIPPSSPLEDDVAHAGCSILSTSRESYGSFPSYISSGVHGEDIRAEDTQSVEHGSNPTSSRLARLDRLHQLWKEKKAVQSSFLHGQVLSSRASCASGNIDTTFIEDTQLGLQALQSQLQDDYSSTDEDESQHELEPDTKTYMTSEMAESTTKSATSDTAIEAINSERPTPMMALSSISVNQVAKPRATGIPKPSPSSTQPLSKKRKKENPPSPDIDFSKLPTDAFPPAPKVSTLRPGKLPSQITSHLATLKTQNPKRFKLSKRHGTPKYDDRGYWLVDTSHWPLHIQQDFWLSMRQHVLDGKLGWAVSLWRDASWPQILGHTRFYCWAEIVEHAWLMMWVASRGRIIGSGSQWVNADGEILFEML